MTWRRASARQAATRFDAEEPQGAIMKTHYIVGLALLAGFALGASAVQKLHAQSKPPTYYITEIEVTDLDASFRSFAVQGLPVP